MACKRFLSIKNIRYNASIYIDLFAYLCEIVWKLQSYSRNTVKVFVLTRTFNSLTSKLTNVFVNDYFILTDYIVRLRIYNIIVHIVMQYSRFSMLKTHFKQSCYMFCIPTFRRSAYLQSSSTINATVPVRVHRTEFAFVVTPSHTSFSVMNERPNIINFVIYSGRVL